jgi:hypothetical protein
MSSFPERGVRRKFARKWPASGPTSRRAGGSDSGVSYLALYHFDHRRKQYGMQRRPVEQRFELCSGRACYRDIVPEYGNMQAAPAHHMPLYRPGGASTTSQITIEPSSTLFHTEFSFRWQVVAFLEVAENLTSVGLLRCFWW